MAFAARKSQHRAAARAVVRRLCDTRLSTPATPMDDYESVARREGSDERPRDPERAGQDVTGRVADSVRTPLTLLLGPLQNLLGSPAPALAPGSRRVLEAARLDALKLLQLLETTRGPRDGVPDRTAALVETFRPFCEAAGIRLVADCPSLPRPLTADHGAWEKIVVNIVAAAFNCTLEGEIVVRLRARDGLAELAVSGGAPGIPDAELPRVFDRPAPGSPGATPVGLAFARDVARSHQGSIAVESRGSGVMITARVPLSAASETAGSAVSAPPAPAPGVSTPVRPEAAVAGSVSRTRGHVVIAEDHEETREYLCHVLEGAGFQVEGFSDGAAALATCVARPPDVVVSDVLMPGVGGFELIEHLRAGERTAVVPVLLLSARGGEESRIEGIAAGADDYLVKPLSGRELIARVDGAVRLGRLRREVARREQADLDALFSMAPDGLIVVGPTGAILAANEQAGRLFGYSTAEFAQLRIEALVPSASRAAHVTHRVGYGRAPVARMMHPMRELGGLRRDGTEFIVDIALG